MILIHNFLMLTWINTLINSLKEMQGSPASQRYSNNLAAENPCDIAYIKIASKQCYRHKVYNECQY